MRIDVTKIEDISTRQFLKQVRIFTIIAEISISRLVKDSPVRLLPRELLSVLASYLSI